MTTVIVRDVVVILSRGKFNLHPSRRIYRRFFFRVLKTRHVCICFNRFYTTSFSKTWFGLYPFPG